ncbi:sigma-70 family RNA polymerase sigma factor [Nocardia sp. alder85J]|uniref:sigma-70 family RNA polymerase sigma factor n=1 Tax=Nocardia sp. alder85J TaxID=2862949 RepID=UPI001CD6AF31|nr:sigma-70 family RNA polymerase sigma factor [Nocardia sp. alder85J]MCX4092340.1 sigma-70 family RNA polymerase sigma factor [Nocardia sp. alder85J]
MSETNSTAAEQFEDAWRRAERTVRAYCVWAADTGEAADELLQRTMIAAWRGYAGFRGESAFATWVVRIGEREALRMQAEFERRRRHEVPMQPEWDVPGAPREPPPESGQWLPAAVGRAAGLGVLTAIEHRIILARLADGDSSWKDLAPRFGLSPAACAVVHCRAIPKLRVFLFQHCRSALGGPAVIADAYRRACADPAEPLSGAERAAFEFVVLAGRTDYRRRGWQAHLRRACTLVAVHLRGDVDDRDREADS